MFSNPNVAVEAKRAVYEGLILSILLYGAESWCLTEKLLSLLRIFHNRCIRSMCRVTLKQCFKFRISNEQLQCRLNLRSIDIYITKKQLRWASPVDRMDFERIPRKMLSSWVCNKRPIGVPEFTYGRGLVKLLKRAKFDLSNWHVLAQDKSKWRKMICDI